MTDDRRPESFHTEAVPPGRAPTKSVPPHSSGAAETGSESPGGDTGPWLGASTNDPPLAEAVDVYSLSVPGYELLAELGRGGMGVVYKARQVRADRLVALKMVLAGGHAAPSDLARFRTEAEAVARLQHPGIVQVFDVGEHNGLPFFSMEFCPGGSLAAKLAGTPLPAKEAAALVEKLARAVQAAHEKNVIHRDLKPANVLLSENGEPKVTDFGLAKKLDSGDGATRTGSVMGTPSYMAPEQASGRANEAGPAVDVYALGAILYVCLTGRPPFLGRSVVETLDLVRTQEPVPPSRIQPKVPFDLETICLKAMAKDPVRRYECAEQLAADLRRFLDDESILARRVGAAEKLWRRVRRNPVMFSLTVAVLALATVVGVIATRPAPPAPLVAAAPESDTQDEVLAVVAELDRTDPGWRFEDMEANRPKVPADRDSAVLVREALAKARGPLWPTDDAERARLERMLQGPLPLRLSEDDAGFLRNQLTRVSESLTLARRLHEYPNGRLLAKWNRAGLETGVSAEYQGPRNITSLLSWDVLMRTHDGDIAGALQDCHGMLNCARLFDDPGNITQLIRMAIAQFAVVYLEFPLAAELAAPEQLAAIQGMLLKEAAYPRHEVIARGERGSIHWFMTALGSGDMNAEKFAKLFPPVEGKSEWNRFIAKADQLPSGRGARSLHAKFLKLATKRVEISQRPLHQRETLMKEWEEESARELGEWVAVVVVEGRVQIIPMQRNQARLLTAAVALAAERYRLARGEWPTSLRALVPDYLEAVPADPYDGQPLRYGRTPDGMVIYGVGPDRIDNRGNLARYTSTTDGYDIGFQLWDADKRRWPADADKK